MDYAKELSEAVDLFWKTRQKQSSRNKGSNVEKRDTNGRSAVTGGAQLDGFINLVTIILKNAGVSPGGIHAGKTTLPGYFRPTKDWDLVAVVDGKLLAVVEFKSHVGPSFGNNFNNRIEEAPGSAKDLLSADREGVFKPSQKPWLGWLMLLEDVDKSRAPVRVSEPHFDVFEEYREASYAKRYELFCKRLMQERLYDAACLLLSDRSSATGRNHSEPNAAVNFRHFADSLSAHAKAFVSTQEACRTP